MKPAEAKLRFVEFAAGRGVAVDQSPPGVGIRTMIDFYVLCPAEGCVESSEDGDMLLFQWATLPAWHSPGFELDITRQFIIPDTDEHQCLTQLSLTYFFSRQPDDPEVLESGNRWCRSNEVDEFLRYIFESKPFRQFAQRRPREFFLDYQEVC